jgi:hypothetical protein
MKKKKKKKKIILIIIIVGIIIGLLLIAKHLYYKMNTNDIKVVDKIDNYGYSLEDRDTKLFKENYNSLKDVLNKSEINYEDYAKYEASLFIIDLYTINNKVNKYDIPSLDYLYPDAIDNFKLKIMDSMYRYLKNNSDNSRNQELPEVKSINITDTKKTTYKIGDTTYDAYEISLTWDYVKDLGYDTKGKVIIINKDNKLYVVEYTNS